MVELSFMQKLRIGLFGYVSVGTRMKEGWSAPIMHYAFKCPIHGYVVDYPHGFPKYLGDIGRLDCMECLKIERAVRASRQNGERRTKE